MGEYVLAQASALVAVAARRHRCIEGDFAFPFYEPTVADDRTEVHLRPLVIFTYCK